MPRSGQGWINQAATTSGLAGGCDPFYKVDATLMNMLQNFLQTGRACGNIYDKRIHGARDRNHNPLRGERGGQVFLGVKQPTKIRRSQPPLFQL